MTLFSMAARRTMQHSPRLASSRLFPQRQMRQRPPPQPLLQRRLAQPQLPRAQPRVSFLPLRYVQPLPVQLQHQLLLSAPIRGGGGGGEDYFKTRLIAPRTSERARGAPLPFQSNSGMAPLGERAQRARHPLSRRQAATRRHPRRPQVGPAPRPRTQCDRGRLAPTFAVSRVRRAGVSLRHPTDPRQLERGTQMVCRAAAKTAECVWGGGVSYLGLSVRTHRASATHSQCRHALSQPRRRQECSR